MRRGDILQTAPVKTLRPGRYGFAKLKTGELVGGCLLGVGAEAFAFCGCCGPYRFAEVEQFYLVKSVWRVRAKPAPVTSAGAVDLNLWRQSHPRRIVNPLFAEKA